MLNFSKFLEFSKFTNISKIGKFGLHSMLVFKSKLVCELYLHMAVHLGTQLISLVLSCKNFSESLTIAINTRSPLALLTWHNEERTEGASHAA